MQKLLTTAALTVALALPAAAGGPVVAAEEAFVQEARPSSEGRWVLPVVVGLAVICALACGGDDDPAPTKPADPCNGCQ